MIADAVVVVGQARGVGAHLHVGDHEVECLVRRQRLAEGSARVAALYRNIRKGLEWKRENAVFKIPFLTHPPEIDGIVLENEWRDALEFREEYPLDSATPLPERNSRWRIGYDRNCLYFSAQFEDSDIVAWNTVGKYGVKNKALYEADCFEVFLRPSPAFQHYYEFLTNPEGTSWDMMHCHLKTGRWQPITRY